MTYVHRTTVANSSNLGRKPIFSDKPTLHDSSENIVEECNSVTVTVTVMILVQTHTPTAVLDVITC